MISWRVSDLAGTQYSGPFAAVSTADSGVDGTTRADMAGAGVDRAIGIDTVGVGVNGAATADTVGTTVGTGDGGVLVPPHATAISPKNITAIDAGAELLRDSSIELFSMSFRGRIEPLSQWHSEFDLSLEQPLFLEDSG